MGKYVGMTRVYLVVLTVFVVARFGLEAAGFEGGGRLEAQVGHVEAKAEVAPQGQIRPQHTELDVTPIA